MLRFHLFSLLRTSANLPREDFLLQRSLKDISVFQPTLFLTHCIALESVLLLLHRRAARSPGAALSQGLPRAVQCRSASVRCQHLPCHQRRPIPFFLPFEQFPGWPSDGAKTTGPREPRPGAGAGGAEAGGLRVRVLGRGQRGGGDGRGDS